MRPENAASLTAAIDAAVTALYALRDQVVAAAAAPPTDDWVPQRKSLLPPRVHTRLCRRLLASGDPRAAVRGRTHYLKQSAIDECMRGMPGGLPARPPVPGVRELTGTEKLRRDLAEKHPELRSRLGNTELTPREELKRKLHELLPITPEPKPSPPRKRKPR